MIKITPHPRRGYKIYTDAEKPLILFRTRIKATSTLHKELFMIFILPEFNFVSAIFPETRSFSDFELFLCCNGRMSDYANSKRDEAILKTLVWYTCTESEESVASNYYSDDGNHRSLRNTGTIYKITQRLFQGDHTHNLRSGTHVK